MVTTWRRLAWSRHGEIGVGMADSDGLFDFLLLIFVFWVWMGWILDSYGLVFWTLMGFGLDLDWLVGLMWWVVGCFYYGFAWFFFFFWFWWDFGRQWWRGGHGGGIVVLGLFGC